jgi:hypothetical protein
MPLSFVPIKGPSKKLAVLNYRPPLGKINFLLTYTLEVERPSRAVASGGKNKFFSSLNMKYQDNGRRQKWTIFARDFTF